LQYIQTDPPTKESLSQLIIQLLQYQETKLGKNAQDAITTRLPVSEYKNSFEKYKISNWISFRCDFSWTLNPAVDSV
jgi:hypothetical protein